MKNLLRSLLAFLLLFSVVTQSLASQQTVTKQYLYDQSVVERQQLVQTQQEYLAKQNLQQQRLESIDKTPITALELSQATVANENAKAVYGGVLIAIADVRQSILLLKTSIDSIRDNLQKSELQAKTEIANEQKVLLEKQQGLLQLQRNRLATLNQLQILQGKTITLLSSWGTTLQQLYQKQLETNTIEALQQKITQLYANQEILQQQLNKTQTQQKRLAGKTPSVETEFSEHNIREKLTLNRLGLFLLQLRIRSESYFTLENLADNRSLTTFSEVKSLLTELTQMEKVVKTRVTYLEHYAQILQQNEQKQQLSQTSYMALNQDSQSIKNQYQQYLQQLFDIQAKLNEFLNKAHQQFKYNLYRLDTLPGASWLAWGELGKRLMDVPEVAVKYVGGTLRQILTGFKHLNWWTVDALAVFTVAVVLGGYFLNRYLRRIGHYLAIKARRFSENLLWVMLRLIRKNLALLIAVFLLSVLGITTQTNLSLAIDLMLLIVLTRMVIVIFQLMLVTEITDVVTKNTVLYTRLRAFFIFTAIVAGLMIAAHQLLVAENLRSFVNRISMLVLLVLSVLLFRAWAILPKLLRQMFAVQKNYILTAIKIFCRVLPFTLFSNAIIGLIGYVKLALLIGIFQAQALSVLLGYLVVRGLLFDLMQLCYEQMIRHVQNGWLWVQVFLRPLDTIIRIALVVSAIWVLVIAYHLDDNLHFVTLVKHIYHEPIIMLGSNVISLKFIVRMSLFIAFLIWIGKWSREFAFRVLYQRANDIGLRNSLSAFTQYAVVIFGILIGLRFLGIDLTGLAVVAAAFAAGIGFGLRDLLNNFVSGILLLVERPFRAGDSITLGQYEGEVVSTGMRSMKIRTWDHMDVIVPNSDMFTKPFINWMHQDSIVRSVVKLNIDRTDDPHFVQKLVYQVLRSLPPVVNDPPPEVFMKEISDSLIELEARYFINLHTEKSRPRVRSEVLFALWDCFKKHGIRPPVPHHEVKLRQEEIVKAGQTVG